MIFKYEKMNSCTYELFSKNNSITINKIKSGETCKKHKPLPELSSRVC